MKNLIILTVLLISLNSFGQSWTIDVKANEPNWTSLHENSEAPNFAAGDRVEITASGSWISNGEEYTYNGKEHYDGRHVCTNCWTMALLVKIVDGDKTYLKEFRNNSRLTHRFKSGGTILFICNDDMTTPKHYQDNAKAVKAMVNLQY